MAIPAARDEREQTCREGFYSGCRPTSANVSHVHTPERKQDRPNVHSSLPLLAETLHSFLPLLLET